MRSFARLSVGSLCFALSLSLFLEPASLVTGGISGVAVLLSLFLPLDAGLLFLLLNLPILMIGIICFGKRFMLRTLYATLVSSLIASLVSHLAAPILPLAESTLAAALFGGILMGMGLGLVFKGGGTTGGTDIGVKLLKLRFAKIREGVFFFAIDSFVIALSAIAKHSLFAVFVSALSLALCSITIDLVLYGFRKKKKS